jgi:hypothetical protein
MKYNSQQNISVNNNNNNNIVEGYTDGIVTSLETNNPVSVNINGYIFKNLIPEFGIDRKQKQLSQFCIKSSCNSAYDGKNVSIDMIHYVLKRGCRFLDFEIYWGVPSLPDGSKDIGQTTYVPVVSVSNDPTTPETNSISFLSVAKYIKDNGFNNSICPNSTDPLFIQLRIKYIPQMNKVNNQKDLYMYVAEIIWIYLYRYSYHGKVDKNTDISLLAGKIVIIMDTYANRSYSQLAPGLQYMANMESNSDSLTHTTYEDIITEVENSHSINYKGYVMNNGTTSNGYNNAGYNRKTTEVAYTWPYTGGNFAYDLSPSTITYNPSTYQNLLPRSDS